MSISEHPAMEANPYAEPAISSGEKNASDPTRVMLRKVATRQRWLIACVGLSLLVFAFLELVGNDLPRLVVVPLAGVTLATILAGAAFTFLLASSLYKPWIALLLVLPGIIPYLGLVIILLINVQAIRVLKRNGIRISLFGADPSTI